MKKKLFSAGLAAVFVLSCASAAMAGDIQAITEKEGTAGHEVYATYKPVADPLTVYSVDIKWGSMEFTYIAPATIRTWNPQSHSYTETTAKEGRWTNEEGANKVSLENRSNKALTATITAETTGEYTGITAQAADETLSLADASIGATTEIPGNVSKAETTISLKGALTKIDAKKTPIGSVTVTIKDTEVQP